MKDPVSTGHNDEQPEPARQKLSHEIRSTAQGLLGYLLIFSDDVKPQLNAEQARILERINFYAKKTSDMLMDLLTDIDQTKR
jgi:hypothetical protein